jgi:predicted  nucleic acid-binding Zn-ribbon protein
MNPRLQPLLDLQNLDNRLRELDERREAVFEGVRRQEGVLVQLASEKRVLETAVREAQRVGQEKEAQLQDLEAKIDKLQRQMNQVRNNREYTVLQEEMRNLEADCRVLEDLGLQALGGVDEKKYRLAALDQKIEGEDRLFQELRGKAEEEVKELGVQGQKLLTERERLAAVVDRDDVELYGRLSKSRDGMAVVEARDEACGGCFMQLTPQTVNVLLSDGELVRCPSCSRILYLLQPV